MSDINKLPHFSPMYTSALKFGHLELIPKFKDADVALLGVPFDASVSNRPGTRLAPRAIRIASSMIESDTPYGWNTKALKPLKIVDIGDLPLDYASPQSIYQQISATIAPIIQANASTIAIGGDHSISYGFIEEYAKKLKRPLSLLHFDSHTDTWSDGKLNRIDHGSMFYRAISKGYVDPKKSAQLGIRSTNSDTMDVNIFDNNYIHTHGINKTIAETKKIIGNNPVYLSFDIDFLDPAFAPGTGTPVCGGFNSWQAQQMLIKLAGLNFCGMDLVEVSPPFDISDITSLLGATLVSHMLKLIQTRA